MEGGINEGTYLLEGFLLLLLLMACGAALGHTARQVSPNSNCKQICIGEKACQDAHESEAGHGEIWTKSRLAV